MSRADSGVETILVTGGAGYIGSALVSRLLDSGRAVRVFDPLLYGDDALTEFRAHPRFTLIAGDPTAQDLALRAVNGVDKIAHLGALVGDRGVRARPGVYAGGKRRGDAASRKRRA